MSTVGFLPRASHRISTVNRAKRAMSQPAAIQVTSLIPFTWATDDVSAAMPNDVTLLATWAAMPASSPPVRTTNQPASTPKANRSAMSAGSREPWNRVNTAADVTIGVAHDL